jgi:hypothetical protein
MEQEDNLFEKQQQDLLAEKQHDEKHEGSVPSDESSSLDDQSDYVDREQWGSQFEFILAIVGYAVAFGNLMRFPYLCMRNGGGKILESQLFGSFRQFSDKLSLKKSFYEKSIILIEILWHRNVEFDFVECFFFNPFTCFTCLKTT